MYLRPFLQIQSHMGSFLCGYRYLMEVIYVVNTTMKMISMSTMVGLKYQVMELELVLQIAITRG